MVWPWKENVSWVKFICSTLRGQTKLGVHLGAGSKKETCFNFCFVCLNHLGSQTTLINLSRQIANQFSLEKDLLVVLQRSTRPNHKAGLEIGRSPRLQGGMPHRWTGAGDWPAGSANHPWRRVTGMTDRSHLAWQRPSIGTGSRERDSELEKRFEVASELGRFECHC